MSTLDDILIQKYKTMVGFSNYVTDANNNTTLQGAATITSNLNVLSNSILQGNTTIYSSTNIFGNTNILGNTSCISSLNVSNVTSIQGSSTIISNLNISGNMNILGNLYVSTNTIIPGSVTTLNNLNVSGTALFQNGIITNSINYSTNQILNIYSNTINIGNSNSIINIMGTSNFVASSILNLTEKLIILNINASNISAFDIGGSCGIQILGTSGTGVIQTTSDAKRYQIAPPINGAISYIDIIDPNNNYYISGTSLIKNNVSVFSGLYISGNTIIKGSTTINSTLNISGNTVINNLTSIGSSLIILNNSIFLGSTTIVGSLNISNNAIINGNTTIMGTLFVSGLSFYQGGTTILSSINVPGNLLIQNNTTLRSSLNIFGNSIINGITSINSKLLINSNLLSNGITTVLTNLNVSNNTFLQNNTTFGSNLTVSGNSIINGNITLGNKLSNFNILSKIITKLPEYSNNASAVAAGIPLWGFYRTGGIIKIRLNDIPPTLTLTGGTSVSIYIGRSYTDLGVTGYDVVDGTIPVYLTSLGTGFTNIITNNILVSSTVISTITQTSSLTIGSYLVTYNATDSTSLVGKTSRLLNITLPPPPILTLLGNTTVSQAVGSNYIDSGVTATDIYGSVPVNIISIGTGSTNILSNNVLISGTSTLVTQTSTLVVGNYLVNYSANDSGNIGYNFRSLNIYSSITLIPYNSTNIIWSYIQNNSYKINPTFTTSPNTMYYNTALYGTSGEALRVSESTLASYGFTTNASSWAYVIFIRRTSSPNDNFQYYFDGSFSDWVPNNPNCGQSGQIRVHFYQSSYNGLGTLPLNPEPYNNNTYNIFDVGFFVSFSYTYPSQILKFEMADAAGNVFITDSTPSAFTFNNTTTTPWWNFSNSDLYQYYYGVLYCSTGYLSPTTYIPYFLQTPLYSFPGGSLTNSYWCITNKSKGATWSNQSLTPFNPNQNYSQGLSISFQATYTSLANNGFYGFGDITTGSPTGPGLYIDTVQDRINLVGTSSDTITSLGHASYALGTNVNWLFNYAPNGYVVVYNNGSIFHNEYMPHVVSFTPSGVNNGDVYFGYVNQNNPSFTGSITYIKIWNVIVPYSSSYYTS